MAIKCVIAILLPAALLAFAEPEEQVQKAIVAAYQRSLDALARGDAETAMKVDTSDWVSITLNQAPVTKQEMAPLIRRDIASMKPPPGWAAVWRPDYEKNGTTTGIQIYELKVDGDRATVLCLVGNTRAETIDGVTHQVWHGSHVRDSWIKTFEGWKRRKHEKLTVNERMIDGKPVSR
jgi:hypothetical protein